MDLPTRSNYYQESRNGRICKFYRKGMCKFGTNCRNIHEYCPQILQYREMEASASSSAKQTSNEIEISASVMEESSRKTCGICFDFIPRKNNKRDQIFGILPNCNHCFCFTCIRRWRQSKDFELEVSKGCPECRIHSDFVYPSKVWFALKCQKEQFIETEKFKMQKIDCRYFRQGRGKCPFGNKCLYSHTLSSGRKLDVGPPRSRRRRVARNFQMEVMQEILHWLSDEDDDYFDQTLARQMYENEEDDILNIITLDRLINSNFEDDPDGCTIFT